jgi:putative phosphoesterase
MRIAIVSDTHSRNHTVETVLSLLRERGISLVLHCGDIEDADTVRLFAGFTTHFVFGNCDSDRAELRRVMAQTGATLHEPFGDLELEGRKLAWTHGDDKRLLHDVEQSGYFAYLFYGHTHQAEQHTTGPTRVINPGALHRARPKSFVLLDLASGETESVELD